MERLFDFITTLAWFVGFISSVIFIVNLVGKNRYIDEIFKWFLLSAICWSWILSR